MAVGRTCRKSYHDPTYPSFFECKSPLPVPSHWSHESKTRQH